METSRSDLSAKVLDGKVVFPSFEGKNFSRAFEVQKVLGQAGIANVLEVRVRDARRRSTGSSSSVGIGGGPGRYTVKVVRKWLLKDKDRDALMQEVDVMRELDHPGVQKIYQFYPNDLVYYYTVLEFLEGAELFDLICEKEFYTEGEARDLCKLLLDAIKHCHDRHIVHRDLRPWNVLLMPDHGGTGSIKLTKFGMACSVADGPIVTEMHQSHADLAPEMLLGRAHGTSVDMWSLGLIAYTLIGGVHPFFDMYSSKMYTKIAAGSFNFPTKQWSSISDEAKDFIGRLLVVDRTERMAAPEAITHPWLLKTRESMTGTSTNLDGLKLFNAKRKLRAAVRTVLASRVMHLSLESNRNYFCKSFVLGDRIGQGSMGTVYKARRFGASTPASQSPSYAVKRLDRENMSADQEQRIRAEVHILRGLDHANVMKIFEFHEDDSRYMYMVLELMEGGQLLDRIVEKAHYTELEVRDLCRALLDAVQHMHRLGVIHRDLRPVHLLLSCPTTSSKIDDYKNTVRITGFDSACNAVDGRLLDGQIAKTPFYMAPEMLRGEAYGAPVDLWSIGLIAHVLLVGVHPFDCILRRSLLRKVQKGFREDRREFRAKRWEGISDEAQELIGDLVEVDSTRRLTASEAMNHPWFYTDEDELSQNDLARGLKELRAFNAKRKLRAGIDLATVAEKIFVI